MRRFWGNLTIGLILFFTCLGVYALTAATPYGGIRPEDSCVLVYNEFGHGSGAIVDVNKVLTARHVSDQADLIIQTVDGDAHGVIEVIADPNSDASILIIEGQFDEIPLELDSTPLEVRDEVETIGAPRLRELIGSVFSGRITNTNVTKRINDQECTNLDLSDCHTGHGVSGGPVVDMRGRIRAIHVGSLKPTMHSFAVPVEEFKGDLGL